MKVKNNTNKPIGIGVLNLLPGATEKLPVAYEKHPVVKMLATKKYDAEHTFITLIKEDAPAQAPTPTQAPADGETKYTKEQLEKMKRDELEAIATGLGVSLDGLTNKTMLAEAIVAAQGAETGSEE